ncbi:MAG: DegT/DnrJ/EryC1/StrS family aminotransferase [bacterium]|jgi:perosamine synthetase
MNVYLDNCNIGELEKKYVIEALESGFISTRGPLVKKVEDIFGEYLGGYVAATYSGTAALYLSLKYCLKKYNLDPLKEKIGVIIPSVTFAATAHSALYNNLIPIFSDIDLDTLNIDLNSVEKIIKLAKNKGINVKFIMPVHLYGNPCNMDEILKLSKEQNLIIVEDAAESLASKYKNILTGTFGEFGAFSFNANKVITASSGGIIFSKNKQDIEYIRFLTLQAREDWGYYHTDLGYNYRMTNIEAAILLAQFEKLNYFLNLKKKFFEIYYENFKNYFDILRFQKITDNSISNYWLITIIFNNKKTNITEFQKKLNEKGIPTRRIFYPLPLMEFYKKYQLVDNLEDFYKNSLYIYNYGLNLPSSTKNTLSSIEYTAKTITKIISNKEY